MYERLRGLEFNIYQTKKAKEEVEGIFHKLLNDLYITHHDYMTKIDRENYANSMAKIVDRYIPEIDILARELENLYLSRTILKKNIENRDKYLNSSFKLNNNNNIYNNYDDDRHFK